MKIQKLFMKVTPSIVILTIAIVATVYFIQQDLGKEKKLQKLADIHVDLMDKEAKAKEYEVAKEIVNPSGFINTEELTIGEYIGEKVILIDFWTYSCINCQRTTPYLNLWQEKYSDQGLLIIGIHTPEFNFEENYENVRDAVDRLGIKYPVVMDNDYATWDAYKNKYWPRKYLIDIDGFIVYDHIGEKAYEITEMKIKELLGERAIRLGIEEKLEKNIQKPENVEDVDYSSIATPELYFGSLRNINLGNGVPGLSILKIFSKPEIVSSNKIYLDGEWEIKSEFAQSVSDGTSVVIKYTAEKVFIVASADGDIKVKVLRDGKPVGTAGGTDVNSGSVVNIKDDRLYRLIEDPMGAGEHTLELIIEKPGVRFFAFTFG